MCCRTIVKGEIPDFTSDESIGTYHLTDWYDGLDLGNLDPNDYHDLRTIAYTFWRAYEKDLDEPFELFGCLFSQNTAKDYMNIASSLANRIYETEMFLS